VVSVNRELAEDQGWDDADFLELIMERLWAQVEGKAISAAEARSLRKKALSLPLDEDSCESTFLGIAQTAASLVLACLELATKARKKSLERVASYALDVAKEWIGITSFFNPTGEAKDFELARRWKLKPPSGTFTTRLQSEAEAEYSHNSFILGECDKQRFDVEVLEKHRRITSTLIKLLRESSRLQGVQIQLRDLRVKTQRWFGDSGILRRD
jgi:hypothetical protein